MENNRYTVFQQTPLISWLDNIDFDIKNLSQLISETTLNEDNIHDHFENGNVVERKIGSSKQFTLQDKFVLDCDDFLRKTLPDVFSEDVSFFRAHINKNPKGIQNFFHTDSPDDFESITSLWYLDGYDNFDDGGETKFIYNQNGEDELFSLLPKFGRIAIFDGNVLHAPTSFWTKDRTILAIKYIIVDENSPFQIKKNSSLI